MNDEPSAPSRGKTRWLVALILFALSAGLRLPPTQESYWVDELHTAWTISDTFGNVAPRARDGHQQATYFQMLWLWSKTFGASEMMMRLTSVIAVSLGCSAMFLAVAKHHQSLIAGIAAGVFLAAESNSLFFGTELRPYGGVILASTLACLFSASLWRLPPKAGRQSAAFAGLIATVFAAAVLQITSFGVLVWLPIAIGIRWVTIDWRATLMPRKIDLLPVTAAVLLGLSLWQSGMTEAWHSRAMWASFASASSVSQIANLWPWRTVMIIPLVVLAFGTCIGWRHKKSEPAAQTNKSFPWMLVSVILVATLCFWSLAYFEIAALWHRRYLVACLPMLGWVFAAGIDEGVKMGFATRFQISVATIGYIALLAMTLSHQGTTRKLMRGQWLVHRGEDWRGAIEHVNQSVTTGTLLWLDPGLIEQRGNDLCGQSLTKGDYLRYVVDGPYTLADDVQVELTNTELIIDMENADNHPNILLSRRPESALKKRLDSRFAIRGFGNVSVGLRSSPAPNP
ncbi:hypothetical protein CA13_45840 [Planctomycetes bacterium CA13]|uniref:Glycosyltransferase RgtA/B/C/D-like domain-containing protein n=1 Tax=Novipirellula herctigrandis TaxID=2527986 RepID=A0A5C5Z8F9_9BACT|nr:hypothetical protein CA13_45840 [Planctomycetes bacterium CA13]